MKYKIFNVRSKDEAERVCRIFYVNKSNEITNEINKRSES